MTSSSNQLTAIFEKTMPIEKRNMRGSVLTMSLGDSTNHAQYSIVMATKGNHGARH